MKLTMEKIVCGEEEIIIRYHDINDYITAVVDVVQGRRQRIKADWEGKTLYLVPEQVLYIENVDKDIYLYLADKVVRGFQSLKELGSIYEDRGFFRCSKSMILNIYKIKYLKSEPGSRICATLESGERVMISRKYAKQLRQVLKGDKDEE